MGVYRDAVLIPSLVSATVWRCQRTIGTAGALRQQLHFRVTLVAATSGQLAIAGWADLDPIWEPYDA